MNVDATRFATDLGTVRGSSPVRAEDLLQAVEAINSTAQFGKEYELTFSQDPDTRRSILRLVDRDTHEVVRQLPPDYVLRVARRIRSGGS